MKVCIVGASGKLGQYMVQHALDRGYEVVGVCRKRSVGKLDPFRGHITVIPGATNDRDVIKAVEGCDGVLTVLVPWGVQHYASGTAQAVLDYAPPGARLVFSCGWHITRDGQDAYSRRLKAFVKVFGWLARLGRLARCRERVAGDLAVTDDEGVRTQRHRGAVIRGMPHDERHLALDLRRVHFKMIVPKAAQPVAATSLRSRCGLSSSSRRQRGTKTSSQVRQPLRRSMRSNPDRQKP